MNRSSISLVLWAGHVVPSGGGRGAREPAGDHHRACRGRVLRARLYEQEMEKQQSALAAERRGQIKSGDRSEKIRTYNYPQNRVTDHRIGLTLHQLTEVMDGKLNAMVDALVSHYEAERLEQELAQA